MFIRKRYGESQQRTCPFCGRMATQKTKDGLEVCYQHIKGKLEEIKCSCGSWLEQRSGKFGPYFNCLNCGNVNLKKALEMKALTAKETAVAVKPAMSASNSSLKKESYRESDRKPKETTIDTNDVEYFS